MNSISQSVTLACLLEASAPKAGNVHRGADFEDLSFVDFVSSSVAIAPLLDDASSVGVGRTVLSAVQASQRATQTNAHLGTILLLAPLASVPLSVPIINGIGEVVQRLGPDDARFVYEAIRLANPGGLGKVDAMDVRDDAPDDLLAAMRAAEDRDLIAKQYVSEFEVVLTQAAVWLINGIEAGLRLTQSIVHTQLQLLAMHPDSLIARKSDLQTAQLASTKAKSVLSAGAPTESAYLDVLADFDFWLRSDGNRRNPGTTADIIAAALFVLLREDQLKPPYK